MATLPVTCIISHWNRTDSLNQCLKSIFTMSYMPEEIIVVDDCSNEKLILQDYPFVKVINLFNRSGAPTAKNVGLKECKTKYVWFLDSDTEIVNPNMLYFGYSILENYKEIGVIGGEMRLSENGDRVMPENFVQLDYSTENRYHPITQPVIKTVGCIPTNNFLAPTELIRKVGGFHLDLFVGEDKLVTQQLINLGYKAIIFTEFLVLHHKDSTSRMDLEETSFQYHSGTTFIYGFLHGSNPLRFWITVLISTGWFLVKALIKRRNTTKFRKNLRLSQQENFMYYFNLLKLFIRAKDIKYLRKGAAYAQNVKPL